MGSLMFPSFLQHAVRGMKVRFSFACLALTVKPPRVADIATQHLSSPNSLFPHRTRSDRGNPQSPRQIGEKKSVNFTPQGVHRSICQSFMPVTSSLRKPQETNQSSFRPMNEPTIYVRRNADSLHLMPPADPCAGPAETFGELNEDFIMQIRNVDVISVTSTSLSVHSGPATGLPPRSPLVCTVC